MPLEFCYWEFCVTGVVAVGSFHCLEREDVGVVAECEG